MGVNFKSIDVTAASTAGVTIYTAPANTTAKDVALSAYNGSTTSRSLTFYKIPSGSTLASTKIFAKLTLSSSTSDIPPEIAMQTLEAGDFLVVAQDSGTDCLLSGGVVEIT